jgi:hypothetical protein
MRPAFRLPTAALCLAGVFTASPARAQVPVTVPNNSFESPSTTFVNTLITSWQKLPQPADFNPNQGFTWDQLAGVFLNDPPPATDNITNMDGNQAAYIFNDQGVGLYQTLATNYQVGTSYQLTVGIVGQGGGMPDGSIIEIILYYLDASNNMVPIGTTTATENSTNFPNHTTEFDYSVNIPAVQATDPWANKAIGIEIVSPEGSSTLLGGYWDVDNVRLNSFPPTVPTPGFPGILACAAGLISMRGFWRGLLRRA